MAPSKSSWPVPQKMSQWNTKRPVCFGSMRTRAVCPGSTSASTPRSGRLNPCGTSRDLSSRTTGTPFFSVTSLGTYSKRLTLIGTTRSPWSFDLASTSEAAPINRTTANAEAMPVMPTLCCFISCLLDEILGDVVFAGRFGSRLDIAEAQSLVGLCRVPGDRLAFGRGAWGRKREHQRFSRVMRDMPGHVVMLLVDVSVEHRHIGKRHEQFHRFVSIARCPIPLWIQVKKGPMGEDHDPCVLV